MPEDLWLRQYSISRIARYLARSRYEVEQELKRGNIIYFQGLSEHELKLMAIHKRIKYSARYAQQFIVQTNIYHEERHHLTPETKQLFETKLAQGLSPEKIKQLYADEIPVSARMLRYYIDQGLIQKRLHKDAIVNKNNGMVEIKTIHRMNPDTITFGHWLVYVKYETAVYQRVATLVLVEEKTTYVVLVRIENTTPQDIYSGLAIFLSRYADQVKSLDLVDDWYLDTDTVTLLANDYGLMFYQLQRLHMLYSNRFKAVNELLPDYVDMVHLTQHEIDVLASILNKCLFNDSMNCTIENAFKKELWANG